MKRCLKLFPVVAVLVAFAPFAVRNASGEEKWELPGAKEQAAVDSANKVLDGAYRDLMSKADPKQKRWLREAHRAWIKWRDAEANYVARHGGAVGGSGLRVAYAEAELKLINERIAVLKAYASQAPGD